MKSLLVLLLTIPFGVQNSSVIQSTYEFQVNELVGQWKKVAAGQDVNNNRALEESEKMKLEPTSQDNIHFNSNGKCKVFGMGLEVEGTWLVKNYKGKRTIFIYTDDIADLPQDEKDKSAMRFEYVSLKDGKLVVVPPIFISMLAVYTR
jgi:hypothetical protein